MLEPADVVDAIVTGTLLDNEEDNVDGNADIGSCSTVLIEDKIVGEDIHDDDYDDDDYQI